MKVRHNKLWKLLIDKGMKKSQLREAVGASKSTFAKLGKNENVTLPVLLNICEYLECDFGDIMEAVLPGCRCMRRLIFYIFLKNLYYHNDCKTPDQRELQ